MTPRLILDFDHFTYRAAASCEPTKKKPFLEGKDIAIFRLDDMVSKTLRHYGDGTYEAYIAGEGNWRKDIYPEYKANRACLKRPEWLEHVREHAVLKWKAQIVNDREVDDMCGICVTQEQNQGNQPVLVSLDKDLRQVAGRHYNFVKEVEETISPLEALRIFYKQVITGDLSDHVPAFDGKFRSTVPKFVEELLRPIDEMTTAEEMWAHVVGVYDGEDTIAKRNASVLYVQRDWDDQWKPPSLSLEVI